MTRSRLGLAVATAAAVLLPVLPSAASAASGTLQAEVDLRASSVSAAALDALCAPVDAAARRTPDKRRVTPGNRDKDHPVVSASDLAALDVPSNGTLARRAARTLDDSVEIPVHVVLVRGAHRGDAGGAPGDVDGWIDLMNVAYAGGQAPGTAAASRYTFAKTSVRQVRNDRWFHAVANSAADKQMRRQLHRGGPDALNLYITKPGRGDDILGFARFPWQYKAAPRLDGVTINVESLPGGGIRNYDEGDTLVHEVGHWMGLFHTFQGGCNTRTGGDQVADTPAEARPSFFCEIGRNTCKLPGRDPIRNFMNYSYDSCMNQFTLGQVARMDLAYEQYRWRP